ncbi:MAG: hypothetical protein ABF804_08280 [Liquorilactobacillus ghanensis]|uniref:hypothetical protein n=1 Tax=Liquorilactobacillus ghanensis TaxID=399370 RepID=UPI0039E871FE
MTKQIAVSPAHNRSSLTLIYFIISICLNSLGNAITVSLNLGSALWTAAAVNLSHATSLPLSWLLFAEGFFAIALNILLLKAIDWRRILGNLIFMSCFSYLVGLAVKLLAFLPLVDLNIVAKVILDCFGIVLIATAISIYQRVNLMLHPCDDLMQIMRFKLCGGNSTKAQLLSFALPIAAICLTVLVTRRLYAINIGTIFSLAFQGYLVGLADQRIFPHLKHRNLHI